MHQGANVSTRCSPSVSDCQYGFHLGEGKTTAKRIGAYALQYGPDDFLYGGNERGEIRFGTEGTIFKIYKIVGVGGRAGDFKGRKGLIFFSGGYFLAYII